MAKKVLYVALAFSLMVPSIAHARPRRTYSNSSNSYVNSSKTYSYTSGSDQGSSDQERCQAEANYMAANSISGHVWGCIGRFEGV